jgi:hypothetical protein
MVFSNQREDQEDFYEKSLIFISPVFNKIMKEIFNFLINKKNLSLILIISLNLILKFINFDPNPSFLSKTSFHKGPKSQNFCKKSSVLASTLITFHRTKPQLIEIEKNTCWAIVK